MTSFKGLAGTGRISASLLEGRRARIGLPGGILDLIEGDATGTVEADRYFARRFSIRRSCAGRCSGGHVATAAYSRVDALAPRPTVGLGCRKSSK